MNSVLSPVQQGARLLDRENPGWYRHIDNGALNLANTRNCVLGQLYGRYTFGAMWLGICGREERYGFNIYRPTFLQGIRNLFTGRFSVHDFAELTSEWREEIARRRLADISTQLLPVESKVYA